MLLIKPSGKSGHVDSFDRGQTEPGFRSARYIKRTLRIDGEFSIIRLSDGRRMVVISNSKKLPINELATEILHKLSEQRATVRGLAVIATLDDLGMRWRKVGRRRA